MFFCKWHYKSISIRIPMSFIQDEDCFQKTFNQIKFGKVIWNHTRMIQCHLCVLHKQKYTQVCSMVKRHYRRRIDNIMARCSFVTAWGHYSLWMPHNQRMTRNEWEWLSTISVFWMKIWLEFWRVYNNEYYYVKIEWFNSKICIVKFMDNDANFRAYICYVEILNNLKQQWQLL